MSYTFLQEQGEESSVESFLDIPVSVLSNLTQMQEQCCCPDRKTDSFQDSQSGMTSKHLMESHGEERLMSSVVDSHAKTSVLQIQRHKESQEVGQGFGNTWQELWMRFDPKSSLLKTHQCLWEEGLQLSSVTLPQWGMMQDGVFLGLAMQELGMKGNDAGSWPTPLKSEGPGSQQMKLTDAVAIAEGFKPRYYKVEGMEGRKAFTGKVNPEWEEWLMGWPMGWTNDLKELATDKFQQWLNSHGKH